ncbi:MAG: hypothetical protein PHW00_06315 [Clostridia bacterium]|nr:hypothetical protein [Clostridia bacterium]
MLYTRPYNLKCRQSQPYFLVSSGIVSVNIITIYIALNYGFLYLAESTLFPCVI